jgi:hypothetical protein
MQDDDNLEALSIYGSEGAVQESLSSTESWGEPNLLQKMKYSKPKAV